MITLEELKTAMMELGENPTQAQLQNMIAEVDGDGYRTTCTPIFTSPSSNRKVAPTPGCIISQCDSTSHAVLARAVGSYPATLRWYCGRAFTVIIPTSFPLRVCVILCSSVVHFPCASAGLGQ